METLNQGKGGKGGNTKIPKSSCRGNVAETLQKLLILLYKTHYDCHAHNFVTMKSLKVLKVWK